MISGAGTSQFTGRRLPLGYTDPPGQLATLRADDADLATLLDRMWNVLQRFGILDGAMAGRLPPARSIARAMQVRHERLARLEAVMVTAIETALPALSAARELVDRFHRMIRGRTPDALPAWIAEAQASMLASFGRGIAADQPAVRAALSEPWSNGPTEGFITRLMLLRRQMYGRGKLDLLRARLLAPA